MSRKRAPAAAVEPEEGYHEGCRLPNGARQISDGLFAFFRWALELEDVRRARACSICGERFDNVYCDGCEP